MPDMARDPHQVENALVAMALGGSLGRQFSFALRPPSDSLGTIRARLLGLPDGTYNPRGRLVSQWSAERDQSHYTFPSTPSEWREPDKVWRIYCSASCTVPSKAPLLSQTLFHSWSYECITNLHPGHLLNPCSVRHTRTELLQPRHVERRPKQHFLSWLHFQRPQLRYGNAVTRCPSLRRSEH